MTGIGVSMGSASPLGLDPLFTAMGNVSQLRLLLRLVA